MGKKASNPAKSGQKRPSVQNKVLERIVELKNSGMGFRKISKQLEKEGLATVGKSTVANYWKEAQTLRKSAVNDLSNDPNLRALAKTEAKLKSEVNHEEMVTQANQRIRDLQIQKAEMRGGLQKIFRKKNGLKEFALQTLQDSKILKDFKLYCKANRLPLAETVANAVGSLDEYEAEKEALGGVLDFSSYVEERLDTYRENENKRRRQEQRQKEFSAFMLNFKCIDCNAGYESMTIDRFSGEIVCKCALRSKIRCLECGTLLDYDADKNAFFCRKCHTILKEPTLR